VVTKVIFFCFGVAGLIACYHIGYMNGVKEVLGTTFDLMHKELNLNRKKK